MSNYPHIKDNPWLALENCNLVFLDERNDEGGSQTCSIVVRLAPNFVNGKQQPLRFEKRSRIQKDGKNEKGIRDYQVVHEDQVFRIMQQSNISIAKIPQRLNMYEDADGDHILSTKDTGLDASKWCEFPLFLKRNNRQYSHVFCHPLAFLYFIKGTLLALYEIHKIGLFHCDIKLDQICIPFNKQGKQITLDFHNITLIDFGIAIWEMVPVVNRNPVRFTSGNMKKGNYAADVLIDAGDYQKNIFKTTGKFDFNTLLEQIDCAVDLYSFGFMLDGLEVTQYPEDRQAWRSFRSEYEAWVDELLSLSNKKTPFKNNLPHQQYIDKIDGWIAKTTKILGYGIGELRFDLVEQQTTPPIKKITPTPTPMPNDIGLEEKQTPIVTRTPLPEPMQGKPQHTNPPVSKSKNIGWLKSIKSYIQPKRIALLVIFILCITLAWISIYNIIYPPKQATIRIINNPPEHMGENLPEDSKDKSFLTHEIIDYSKFKLLKNIKLGTDSVQSLDFLPTDSDILATSSDDWQSVKILSIKTGKVLKTFESGNTGVSFSSDGRYLATASSDESMLDNNISIYNLNNDVLLQKITTEDYINSVNFSGNDKYLIYQGSASIMVQSTIDKQDKFSIGDEENPVLHYAVAKDRDILAYAQKDRIYLYNLERREIINDLPYENDNRAFTLSTDGKMVFLLKKNGDIEKMIAYENGSMLKGIIRTQSIPDDIFSKIQVTPNNLHIIYTTERFVDIYNLSTNKRVNRFQNNKEIWSSSISKDGRYIAIGHTHPFGEVSIYTVDSK